MHYFGVLFLDIVDREAFRIHAIFLAFVSGVIWKEIPWEDSKMKSE